jgi:acyl-CoA thioester hydrolase
MTASADERPATAYTHHIVVPADAIDALGHVGNVTWVDWVNDTAIAHSRAIGLTPEVYAELGVVWVVRKHEIEYLVSALEGEVITATTWVENLRGATSLRRTEFHRARDAKLLVRAQTTWALIESASGRPRRVPRDLLERYGFGR